MTTDTIPQSLDALSSEQRSLLMFLECCATDGGRVNGTHMNAEDFRTVNDWNASGFIEFGRIYSKDTNPKYGSHWVKMSNHACKLAHQERMARATRLWEKRTWITTQESR